MLQQHGPQVQIAHIFHLLHTLLDWPGESTCQKSARLVDCLYNNKKDTIMMFRNYCLSLHKKTDLIGLKDRNLILCLKKKRRTQCRELPLLRGLGKGVRGKPYPHLCNARRPRLEPGTFRSQAVRLYRLHQARPSCPNTFSEKKNDKETQTYIA